jgi:AcrR family transcriptional regulator
VSGHDRRTRPADSGDPIRDRIARAMIKLSGRHGYEATTVEALCGLADVPRSEFSRRFSSKEDCFLNAWDEQATEFGKRILDAYQAHSAWHDSVWSAGWAAMAYLQEDPLRARFFALEVGVTGVRGQARGDAIMHIFADLLEDGKAELDAADAVTHATAEMAAGAIYITIRDKILEGAIDRGEDFLAELVYLAVLPYLGARAAESELEVQSLRQARAI